MSDVDLELYGVVGRMFREIREDKGLSLEIVSEHLNIAPKSLQRYECGERKIKMGVIKELCSFYKIDYDAFIIEAKLRFGKDIYTAKSSNETNVPKIIQYYEILNDIGKHVATERVKELAEVPRYVKEDMPDYLKPKAARNDYIDGESEIEKVQSDLSMLDKYKKND